ncbi:WD40 repeat-like protein [Violaceomyces palustris]|uniref:WD40 repeat-like protein n=1 Tax=Violaceomyces palustris TaxID=1673888 RepID=A0ACD0P1Z8_9BASI|nr:WD40 repeat-like protein [Violaceomyces palustris]
MRKPESLWSTSTVLSADSVESHPLHRGLFALGTYQVEKEEEGEARSPDQTKDVEEADEEAQDSPQPSQGPAYSRSGRCYLRNVEILDDNRVECSLLQQIEMPAILDMKWTLAHPSQTTPTERDSQDRRSGGILGIANSVGEISLQALSLSSSVLRRTLAAESARLEQFKNLRMNPKKALCLSLDWSDRRGGHVGGYDSSTLARDTSLIVSQSDGTLAFLPSLSDALRFDDHDQVPGVEQSLTALCVSEDTTGDDDEEEDEDEDEEGGGSDLEGHLDQASSWEGKPAGLETWKAHDYEAWIASFDCWSSGRVVWSGGDDLKLKGWDLRSANKAKSGRKPTFSVERGFEGGVTSLQSHHLRENLWAVGSYDSKVRIFDSRMMASSRPRSRPVSEVEVGGGVWRLKWHPSDPKRLLVGCMHDGFKVLRLDSPGEEEQNDPQMEVVTRFDRHQSLAYGCDWDRGITNQDDDEGSGLVLSCSFYDAMFHIWKAS